MDIHDVIVDGACGIYTDDMLMGWRYKRFHVSYIISWLSFGLLAGLSVSRFIVLPFSWSLVFLFVIVGVFAFRSRRWYGCLLIVIVGVLLGLLRGESYTRDLAKVDSYIDKTAVLVGTISQDPIQKDGTNQWRTQLSNLKIGAGSYFGDAYVTVVSDEPLKRGDVIGIEGKLKPGFGSFVTTIYRADLKKLERPNDVFLKVRDVFSEGVRKVMPEPEASLGLGFIVGQKSALPEDLEEQLKIVGLTHIVVASGYNLTILVRFARQLLAKKSRYLAMMGSVSLVAGFVAVSGLSPSMNRAAIVTGLSLLAWYYGRKFHPLQLILYVAGLSAFIYPVYLWSDLGWALSFTAFFGVLVVAPIVTRLLYEPDKKPSAVTQLVIETLSAEVMTLPMIIVSFGYVPVLALLANVVVAPVIPFAMLATFVAGVVGLAVPALVFLALPATIVIAYVVAVVGSLSGVSWSQLDIVVSPWVEAVWYACSLLAVAFIWRKKNVDLRASSVVD